MIYSKQINKAIKIAFKAHINQTDFFGVPYIFHPWEVASQLDDEESRKRKKRTINYILINDTLNGELESFDIITKIDGVKVASMEELSTRLQYYEKGEKVVFTIEYLEDREYVEKEVTVVLSENKE